MAQRRASGLPTCPGTRLGSECAWNPTCARLLSENQRLREPFGVSPANAINDLDLPLHADSNVYQIVDVLEELSLDVAREDKAGSLSQDMDLAKKKAVVFVR
jgi:hypothetical protein